MRAERRRAQCFTPCCYFILVFLEAFVAVWFGCLLLLFGLLVSFFCLPVLKLSKFLALLLAGSLFNSLRVEMTDNVQSLIGNCTKKTSCSS